MSCDFTVWMLFSCFLSAAEFFTDAVALLFCAKITPFLAELLEACAACLPVAILAPPRAAVFAVTGFVAFFARAPLPEFVF